MSQLEPRERDGIGMAGVFVSPVDPVCGDLEEHVVEEDRHGAVLQAGLDGPVVGEHGKRLLRKSGCRDVPVFRGVPEQRVARAAADDPGFKAGSLQEAESGLDRTRQHDIRLCHRATSCQSTRARYSS